eukprot:6179825-Amphidinium_carterae.2
MDQLGWRCPRRSGGKGRPMRLASWRLMTVNATTYGSFKRQWETWRLAEERPQLVLLQELHRRKQWFQEDAKWLRDRGACIWAEHSPNHGGTAVIARTHIAGMKHLVPGTDGRACAVEVHGVLPHGILVISVYLATGVPVHAQLDVLAAIGDFLQGQDKPWLMAGDFQCEPAQMRQTEFPSSIAGVIVSTSQATCSTPPCRELDYWIVSVGLVPLLQSVSLDTLCQTRPHTGVALELRSADLSQKVPVWRRPKGHLEEVQMGPHQEALEHAWSWPEGTCPSDLEAAWLELVPIAHQELARYHGEQDRKTQKVGLVEIRKELHQHQTHWKENRETPEVAGWRWLRAIALHETSWLRPRRRPHPKIKEWLGELCLRGETWDLDRLLHVLHTGGFLERGLLVSEIVERCKYEERKAAQLATDSWKAWAKESVKKGGRAAHAFSREKTVPVQCVICERKNIPVVGQSALDIVEQEWRQIWESHGGAPDITLDGPDLPPMTLEHLQRITHRYPKHKALGVDGLSVRCIGLLPRSLQQRLLDLLGSWERDGLTCKSLCSVYLITPKPGGGWRPIALLPSLFRVWGKLREDHLRAWAREQGLPAHWGGKGKEASKAGWYYAMQLEYAAAWGLTSAAIFADLRKFYEFVQHESLIRSAKLANAPLRLLQLACRMYRGPRAVSWQGLVTQARQYRGSVTPGCVLAVSAAKVLLWPMLCYLRQKWPLLTAISLVDDLSLHYVGREEPVEQEITEATSYVLDWLAKEGLPCSQSKCKILCNHKNLRQRLQTRFQPEGFVAAKVTRHLGHDAAGNLRRRVAVRTTRRKAAARRMVKLRQLRKAGAKVQHIARTGAVSMRVWGGATVGLTAQQVQQDRQLFLRGVMNWPMQASVGMGIVSHRGLVQLDPAGIHHGQVFEEYSTMLSMEYMDRDQMGEALYGSAKKLIGAPHPWRRAQLEVAGAGE